MTELPFLRKNGEKGRAGFNQYLSANPNITEEERRKAEMEFLVPEKKPDPTKARTFTKPHTRVNVETILHKVMVYFHKEEDYHLFRKYVKVNDYIETNTYDVKLISTLFRAIDDGSLTITEEGEIKMRTLPCKLCGKPYTDNIEEKVNPAKGGYIICARCASIDPTVKEEVKEEEPKKETIKWKKKNT